jgi:hypothetical protein
VAGTSSLKLRWQPVQGEAHQLENPTYKPIRDRRSVLVEAAVAVGGAALRGRSFRGWAACACACAKRWTAQQLSPLVPRSSRYSRGENVILISASWGQGGPCQKVGVNRCPALIPEEKSRTARF